MYSHFAFESYRYCITEGLRVLGVDNLFLQIHDPSFPSFEDEETGYGSPYTRGAAGFLKRVRNVGYNGLQLGPQGITSADNPSPYDGTFFSRNPLSVSLDAVKRSGLLSAEQLDDLLSDRPHGRQRVHYQFAYEATQAALNTAYHNFHYQRERKQPKARWLAKRLADFRMANADWLERDALYTALVEEHRGKSWQNWLDAAAQPDSDQRLWDPEPGEEAIMQHRRVELTKIYAADLEHYAFVQLLAHEQHDHLRRLCSELGLKLYADLQIGMSNQDAWNYRALCLQNYRMGAPPSRTNPEGQPWGFRMLDPQQYFAADGSPGPVMRFVDRRLSKVFAEYDGLRVDHPQGWVCPWVYSTDIPNPFQAVQDGARLFSSPDLIDHPHLRQFALVRAEQLNRDLPRHADHWVNELNQEQVTRYAALFSRLAPHDMTGRQEVMCEVLSTMPYPLRRVMERHGLGRFRVLQNADPNDPYDVYRSDNAQPADWIMLGNHDTRPIWQLARHWCTSGQAHDRAADLSRRLVPREADRPAWTAHVANHPGVLVHALFADMLHSKARNIMVFVSDMLGVQERYNTPGTISEDNWSLRVPPDFEESYLSRVAEDQALSLPYAILLALKARPDEVDNTLIMAMEVEVERLRALGRSFARSATP
ncbi:MAG: 4-alpha-glucanotransferase [Candidatus Competibacteraceae bacterium]|nr:4-alpha-glucanotransferase [Candidatus Competibacteraceae bacterium]